MAREIINGDNHHLDTLRIDDPFVEVVNDSSKNTSKIEIVHKRYDQIVIHDKLDYLHSKITLSDMVYYSFVNFTNTGFGEIRAISPAMRTMTIIQNLIEVIFITILIASIGIRAQPDD